MKNNKTPLLDIIINSLASLYDFVIALFASIYDLVFDFILFLWEYVKWITHSKTAKSTNYTHAEETIKSHYQQTPFDVK